MDPVDTLYVGRYWSEVLCCTITPEWPRGQGHGSILIDLVAKHKSGVLRCPATALIPCVSKFCMQFYVFPGRFRLLLQILIKNHTLNTK